MINDIKRYHAEFEVFEQGKFSRPIKSISHIFDASSNEDLSRQISEYIENYNDKHKLFYILFKDKTFRERYGEKYL